MPNDKYERIELTLKDGDLETIAEFDGVLLGKATFVDKQQESRLQELIKIFKRNDGKFVTYMEYSDSKEGIWESKMCVRKNLDLLKIRKGLTRNTFKYENLRINNVPSEILGLAAYRAAEKIQKYNF